MHYFLKRLVPFLFIGVLLTPFISFADTSGSAPIITSRLTRGSIGSEVRYLQEFLTQTGDFLFGNITGYFGGATEAAVKRFQERNEIVKEGTPSTTGFGAVGPKTRQTIVTTSRAQSQASNPAAVAKAGGTTTTATTTTTSNTLDRSLVTGTAEVFTAYTSRCELDILYPKGSTRTVYKYQTKRDGCASATSATQAANPLATITRAVEVPIIYSAGSSNFKDYSYGCRVQVALAKGGVETREYVSSPASSTCATLSSAFTSDPTIQSVQSQSDYRAYFETGSTFFKDYRYICIFTLQGASGAPWTTQRLNTTDDACAASLAFVKANNPRATVLTTSSVVADYTTSSTASSTTTSTTTPSTTTAPIGNESKIGVVIGPNANTATVNKVDFGSWYYTYLPTPNNLTKNINTLDWSVLNKKEFVPMVSGTAFTFADGSTCALGWSTTPCQVSAIADALTQLKSTYSSRGVTTPRYLMGFNEPSLSSSFTDTLESAKAWGRLEVAASSTGFAVVSPTVLLDDAGISWYAQFLKSCYTNQKNGGRCNLEQMKITAVHAYQCSPQFWSDNFGSGNQFKTKLITALAGYGGYNWSSYIQKQRIWVTETNCNWDPDMAAAQTQGLYIRDNTLTCQRATGQAAGYGSLKALLTTSAIDRFAWWSLYANYLTASDGQTISSSSQDRIEASRLFDDNLQLTPAGKAVRTASLNSGNLLDPTLCQ